MWRYTLTVINDKTINFKARSKTEFEICLKPYPAVKSLPKWFLDAKPYIPHPSDPLDDGKVHVRDRASNATFKKCTPLLDGMSSGYIIPLWADIEINSNEDSSPSIYWKTERAIFELHGNDTVNMDAPPGYHNRVFKYLNCWIPQTPKGYSCIITSPFGHNDLVIKPIPAVIDTDKSTLELVFPVWIRNDFSGIVEKGTPIVQIIPFKRNNWNSSFDYYEDKEYAIIQEKNFNSTIVGHYIKNHWSKKSYK